MNSISLKYQYHINVTPDFRMSDVLFPSMREVVGDIIINYSQLCECLAVTVDHATKSNIQNNVAF